MPLSVNHYICGKGLTFPGFAKQVSDAGVKSVGITCAAIEEMGLHDLDSCLKDYGLAVSSLNSAGYFTPKIARPHKYSDKQLIEFSAYLNAEILCVITGGLGSPPLPLMQVQKFVEYKIEELAKIASRSNVTIGLEPINPIDIFTKGCINSISHALNIIRPHDNAKLILDIYHSWWDPDFLRVMNEEVEQIGLVQICNIGLNSNMNLRREPITEGVINLASYLPTLFDGGYSKKLELELFNKDLTDYIVADIISNFPKKMNIWLN